jgi:hypothetical protein
MFALPFNKQIINAETPSALVIGDVNNAEIGEIIEVPVSLQDNIGFLTLNVTFSYDPEKLELADTVDTGLLKGHTKSLDFSDPVNGIYRLSYADMQNVESEQTESGEFIILQFKVLDNFGDNVETSVTCPKLVAENSAYDDISEQFYIQNGKVSIGNEDTNAEKAVIEVGKATGLPGDIVQIPLNISKTRFLTLQIQLQFDSTALEFLDFNDNGILKGNNKELNVLKDNTYTFSYSDFGNPTLEQTAEGTFATLDFKILDTEVGDVLPVTISKLVVEDSQYEFITSEYTTVDGSITIAEQTAIRGDLNNDGQVNLADFVIMVKVFQAQYPTIKQADVYSDGTISVFDVAILKRTLLTNILNEVK